MPALLQNAAAPQFIGEFRHKVEGRNRVTVPADWRVEEEIDLFMIAKAQKACVMVMTQLEVDRMMEAAVVKYPDVAQRSIFRDMLGSQLRKVKLDKGGRVSIPDDFFGVLGLPEAKEVWLSGSMGVFNIWSLPEFEEHKANERLAVEEMKRNLGI